VSVRKSLRVLVVDDSAHARTITKMVLQAIDADVRECPDGQAGLQELRSWTPDLIIVDYEMRPINGAEFTWRLRALEAEGRKRRTPVLMVTGHNASSVVSNAVQAGVDGFINKPITTGMLLGRVEKVLAHAKLAKSRGALPSKSVRPVPESEAVHYIADAQPPARRAG